MSHHDKSRLENTKKQTSGAVPKHPASLKLPVPRLRQLDVMVTVGQLIAVIVAFFSSEDVRNTVAVGFSAVFVAGAILFSWAFLIAASRSRSEDVTVAGAFFLAGSIDAPDRRWAFGLLTAQTAIGVAGAASDLYTTMAFGILVPMFGLGVIAFLGSAHGAFRHRKSTK